LRPPNQAAVIIGASACRSRLFSLRGGAKRWRAGSAKPSSPPPALVRNAGRDTRRRRARPTSAPKCVDIGNGRFRGRAPLPTLQTCFPSPEIRTSLNFAPDKESGIDSVEAVPVEKTRQTRHHSARDRNRGEAGGMWGVMSNPDPDNRDHRHVAGPPPRQSSPSGPRPPRRSNQPRPGR
jgi:hypothetical protein